MTPAEATGEEHLPVLTVLVISDEPLSLFAHLVGVGTRLGSVWGGAWTVKDGGMTGRLSGRLETDG